MNEQSPARRMPRPAARHVRLVPPDEAAPRRAHGVEDLYEEHSRYVAAIAFRLLGRDEEVNDVVQDVFLELVRGLEHLERHDALRGWLATVTVRVAGKLLRRRRLRHRLGLESNHDYDDVSSPDADPEDRALLQRVYQALDRLPVQERVAWTLRHVQGERLDAVAQYSGCSLATAKRRILAADHALRQEFGDD